MMKLPNYLTHELARRLSRDAPRKETENLLAALGIPVAEPGPEPDYEDMLDGYDGDCQTGSFMLEGTLDFIGHKVPMHFRIRYAGPIDEKQPWDMFKGPSMAVDILTWHDSSQGEPEWVPVGAGVLSDAMVEDIWPAISLHASEESAELS